MPYIHTQTYRAFNFREMSSFRPLGLKAITEPCQNFRLYSIKKNFKMYVKIFLEKYVMNLRSNEYSKTILTFLYCKYCTYVLYLILRFRQFILICKQKLINSSLFCRIYMPN